MVSSNNTISSNWHGLTLHYLLFLLPSFKLGEKVKFEDARNAGGGVHFVSFRIIDKA